MNSEFTNFEYIPIPPKPYHPVRALKPDRPASYTSFNFPTKNHTLLLIEKHGSGRIIFACSKFYRDILVYPGKIVMRIGNPSNEHIKIENLAGKMESSIEYETMVRYSLKIPDIKSYSKDEFVSETHLTAINIGAINDEFVIQPPSPLHRALMSFPSHTFYYKDKQSTSQEYKIDTLQRYKSFIDSFCQTFDVTSYTESGTFIAGHESEEEIAEIVKQNKKCLLIISLSNGYLPERWIKICGKLDLIVKHGMEVLFVLDGFDSEFLSKNMPKRFNWYGAQASAQFFLPEIFPEPLPILPSAANSIEEIVSIGTSLTSVISNLNENPRFKKKKGLFDFELSKEPKDLLDAIRELHPLLNLFLASTFVKEFVLNLTLNSYLIDTVGYVKFNFWFQGVWSEIVWRSWYLETEKNDTFLMILIRALFYLLRSKFKMFSENPMDLEKVPDPQRNPPAYSTVSTIFASSKQTTSRQIHVADAANLKIHDVRRVFDSTFSYFDRELCNSVLRYLPVLFFGPSLFTAGIYNSSDQKLLLDYSKSQPEKVCSYLYYINYNAQTIFFISR